MAATRERLPNTRHSVTSKGRCGNHDFYIILGFYEDGRLGEVFINIAKEGSIIGGMFDALGTTISIALQHGVPWEAMRDHYRHMRFDPAGASLDGREEYPSLVHAVAAVIDATLDHRASVWGDPAPTPTSAPSPQPERGA